MKWTDWYRLYEAGMGLTGRLNLVRSQVAAALDERPPGPFYLTSICAGDGRDVIPVVAEHRRAAEIDAGLIDLDAEALERGRQTAEEAGMAERFHFRCADATQAASYQGLPAADLLIVSGVLGHLNKAGLAQLAASLPMLLKPGGHLLWSRHQVLHRGAEHIAYFRGKLAAAQFEEVFFQPASSEGFVVGRAIYQGPPIAPDARRKFFEFIGIDRLLAEEGDALPVMSWPAVPPPLPGQVFAPLKMDPEVPLATQIERLAQLQPDRPALDGGWLASYRQLDEAANRLAHKVLAQGGGIGDRVALLLAHDTPLLAAALAVLKTGRIVVVLNPADPVARHQQVLDDAEPRLLLIDAEHWQTVQALPRQPCTTVQVEAYLQGDDVIPPPPIPVDVAQTAFIIYTSGSTGKPKGVLQSHRNIAENVRRLTRAMQVRPSDRVALLTSLSGGLGLSTAWGTLLNGASLCFFPSMQLGVSGLDRWMHHRAISVFLSSASIFRSFVQALAAETRFPRVRLVRVASEQATSADFAAFCRHFPASAQLLHTLSSSEAGNLTQLVLRPGDPVPDGPLPVGRPAAGIELRLMDEAGNEVPPGQIGEIVVRGAHLSKGYWRDPDLTERSFKTLPDSVGLREFRGGDLGRWDERNQLIFMGRKDHRVKIHGYRVELAEVESVLNRQPAVRESAVVARPLPNGGVSLVAYVVLQDGRAADERTLRETLRAQLPGPMLPAHLVFLQALPLTPGGKLDRQGLVRRPLDSGTAQDDEYEPPQTAEESFLAGLWSELFDGRRVGRNDDFFHLGADSLSAVAVAAKVDSAFGVRLDLRDFSQHSQLQALAAEIARRRGDGKSGRTTDCMPLVSRENPLPLSFQEERVWRYSQSDEQAAGYIVTVVYRLSGPLDVEALQASLTYLTAFHEILRTTYRQHDGRLERVVHPPGSVTLERLDVRAEPDPEAAAQQRLRELSGRPFDLQAGPLLRFCLLDLGVNEHLLARINQHIISDGPSWDIYLRDLKPVYELHARAQPPALPEDLPLQYADYAAWQRDQYHPGSPAWEAMIAWWKERFSAPLQDLAFPFTRPQPLSGVSPREGIQSVTLNAAAWQASRDLAAATHTTPYVVRLSAFAAVLVAATRQSDLVIGMYVTNRDRSETQGMFGFFAHLAALRLQCDRALSFRAWVDVVRQTISDAQAHTVLSYDDLSAELRRAGVETPPIKLIVSEEPRTAAMTLGAVQWQQLPRWSGPDAWRAMPWGFTLSFTSGNAEAGCSARFDANLYDPAGARRLLHQVAAFFVAAARQPQSTLTELWAAVEQNPSGVPTPS
jgi:amino acid adenylation domain-containing protein